MILGSKPVPLASAYTSLMSPLNPRFSSSSRSIRSMKDFRRSTATPPTSGMVPLFPWLCCPRSAAPKIAIGPPRRKARAVTRRILVLLRGGEGGLLLWARLFLIFRLPFVVGHAVDDFPRLRVRQRDAALLSLLAIPPRQAVATKAGHVHQIDVLDIVPLAQMLDEPPEGRGFELGAGLVVHRVLLFVGRIVCNVATTSVEALPALRRRSMANLLDRQILLMRGDEPAIAEWVLDPADAITVKLIGNRPDKLSARCHSARYGVIDVLDIEMDRDWRTADGFRAERLNLGVLVGQHDSGIADPDLRMVDLAAGTRQTHDLLGAERRLVEGDSVTGTIQDQIGRHTVIALGDRLHCCGHIALFAAWFGWSTTKAPWQFPRSASRRPPRAPHHTSRHRRPRGRRPRPGDGRWCPERGCRGRAGFPGGIRNDARRDRPA